MISLIEIFRILRKSNTPTEIDWKAIFSSVWHKTEKLPIEQILGLQEEIAKATTNFKGYHTDEAALNTAYPKVDNKKDFFAWVGSKPTLVWKVYANTGDWVNTGDEPTEQEIDLAAYAKKTEIEPLAPKVRTDGLQVVYARDGVIDIDSLGQDITGEVSLANRWVDTDTGLMFTSSSSSVTTETSDYIDVDEGEELFVTTAMIFKRGNNPMGIAGYDSNNRYVREVLNVQLYFEKEGISSTSDRIKVSDYKITIPSGVKKIRGSSAMGAGGFNTHLKIVRNGLNRSLKQAKEAYERTEPIRTGKNIAQSAPSSRSWIDTDNGKNHTSSDSSTLAQQSERIPVTANEILNVDSGLCWKKNNKPLGFAGYDANGYFLRALLNVSIYEQQTGLSFGAAEVVNIIDYKLKIPSDVHFITGASMLKLPNDKGYGVPLRISRGGETIPFRDAVQNLLNNGGSNPTDPITSTDVVVLNREKDKYIDAFDKYTSRFMNSLPSLSFLHISDTHTYWNNVSRFAQFLEAHKSLKFGICTGDLINKPDESFDGWFDATAKTEKKVYICVGNHDVANGTTNAQVFDKFIKPNLGKWELGINKPYYYFDDVDSKIRSIVLYEFENINLRQSRYYSQEQIDWICDLLLTTPSDYAVMVFQHQPMHNCVDIGSTFYTHDVSNTTYTTYGNEEPLPYIIQCWMDGVLANKTFNNSHTVNVNFATRGKGEFIAYFNGHEHYDMIGKLAKYPQQLNITIDCCWIDPLWTDLHREEDKVSQDLMNAISIHRGTKSLNIVRIGASVPYIIGRERKAVTINYNTMDVVK